MSEESAKSESPGSVTRLLHQVQADGATTAQEELYRQYYQKVLQGARRWVRGLAVADEDDVAVSVWKSIFRGMPSGKFTECRDRESFEKLLAKITYRKAVNLRNWLRAPRRCPTDERRNEDILKDFDEDDNHRQVAELYYMQHKSVDGVAQTLGISIEEVQRRLRRIRRWLYRHRYQRNTIATGDAVVAAAGDEPGPLETLIVTESFSSLEEKYREPIMMLLQGLEVADIANNLGVCEETVRRRLRFVRKSWEAELKADDEGAGADR